MHYKLFGVMATMAVFTVGKIFDIYARVINVPNE